LTIGEYIQAYAKSKFIKIISNSTITEYTINGILHSINGPAAYNNDFKAWVCNGKIFHKKSDLTQSECFYKYGIRHAINKYAYDLKAYGCVYMYGVKHYIYGIPSEFEIRIYDDELGDYGIEKWFKNGLLHRDHGLPATKYYNTKHRLNDRNEWYKNGKFIKRDW
jgi:hypothetical protein